MPMVLPRAWIKIKMDILSFHSLEHRLSIHFFFSNLIRFYSSFSKPYKISYYRFSSSFNQSLFFPYTPDVRHFTMNQPASQFPFPCVFLTCFLLSVFISKVEKQSAGWHPAFLISRILPTERPEIPQN